ncbi:MAG: phosphate/phosphite/phosphonate ABC transporter substrate-binding protein [Anaerolineales bacterium]|nr:phosphate/phosphite/phosphonate ABC transporter substrate-binding protein [Anaerolineales bacterium]
MESKRFLWVLVSIVIVSSFNLGACGGKTDDPVAVDDAANDMTDDDTIGAVMAGTYYERALAGEFTGTVVSMTGPFTDEDAVKFDSSVMAFEEATGIDIQYEGSKDFEAAISLRVDAGDAPDIADFPQPDLLATFAALGEVVDLSSFLPQSSFDNYNQSWIDMGTMAGPDGVIVAGIWHHFNPKSLVWYPQEEFKAAGYAIPETWDELIALSNQIVADGAKPWCVGIESGAATGRSATDLIEEVMLRTTSLENYDRWVKGELPFNSHEVTYALEVLSDLWKDEYVLGGSQAILTTFYGDAPAPMFEDPPKCWLYKQDYYVDGYIITSFFPESLEVGTDYGFFYLPGIDEVYGRPYLVTGDIMAMFNDRDEVRATMEFFTKGESVKEWLAAGGTLSPHLDADLAWYGNDIEKGIAAIVADATSVRFDGSDLMPREVGAGSFWTGMIDYFSGTADAVAVLTDIDASWPTPKLMVAEGEIGSESAPIKVLFVPSVDVDFMIASGGLVEQALNEATGLYFDVSVPTSYAATIEEMCASPTNTIAFIPAMGYALANELCGVEPALASVRRGWNVYWTMFIVARDSDFQTLEDLEGKSWGFPSYTSTSGYLFPAAQLSALGITPRELTETGGHPQSINAVYNGEVDFATAFYSAPLLPEGFWDRETPPDIPADLIEDCGVNEAGELWCGEYMVLDARTTTTTDAPDVIQKVRILALSDDIVNDTMSFSPDFPDVLKDIIVIALTAYIGTEPCLENICNENFYGWTGVAPISDENFDGIRNLLEAQGITLENIGN